MTDTDLVMFVFGLLLYSGLIVYGLYDLFGGKK